MLRGEEILAKWRNRIDEGIREGNDKTKYTNCLLPESLADTDELKIAAKMIFFKKVDVSKIPIPMVKTKEEKIQQFSHSIVSNTKVLHPLAVTYESDDGSQEGTAIKMDDGDWKILLEGRKEFTVSNSSLLDSQKFQIQHAYQNLSNVERRRAAQTSKRQRQRDQRLKEEEMENEARKRREKEDMREYEKMMKNIAISLLTKKVYSYQDFSEMVHRLRAPYRTEIDGHEIRVTEEDSSIMVKASALDAIRKTIVVGPEQEEKRKEQEDISNPNKRQRTGGVDTTFGNNGLTALAQASARDARQTAAALTKEKNEMKRELQNIEAAIESLERRKNRIRQQKEAFERVGAGNYEGEEYWEVSENSDQSDLVLFLRLFAPTCGKLSKSKSIQWEYIQSKSLNGVSQARLDSKEEEYRQRKVDINTQMISLSNDDESDRVENSDND